MNIINLPVFRSGIQIAEAVVDGDLAHLAAYRWSLDKDGYVRRSENEPGTRRTLNFVLHRVVLDLPKRQGVVDHIDGNKLDCRRANLRVVTQKINSHNRGPLSGRGSSRFRGVHLVSSIGKWRASVIKDGVTYWCGQHLTEEAAAAAAAAWRRENMPESLQDAT